jgi:hypothetical protein
MTSRMTRRDFVERASCATAVLAFARPAVAADGMFVSLNGALTAGKNVGWPESSDGVSGRGLPGACG